MPTSSTSPQPPNIKPQSPPNSAYPNQPHSITIPLSNTTTTVTTKKKNMLHCIEREHSCLAFPIQIVIFSILFVAVYSNTAAVNYSAAVCWGVFIVTRHAGIPNTPSGDNGKNIKFIHSMPHHALNVNIRAWRFPHIIIIVIISICGTAVCSNTAAVYYNAGCVKGIYCN